MDTRLFDYNPETGVTEIFHYDEVNGTFTIEERQDVTDLVEQNKYLMNEDTGRYTETHRVASIPLTVYFSLKQQGILGDAKKFKAWLNDPDNRMFRTKLGRV